MKLPNSNIELEEFFVCQVCGKPQHDKNLEECCKCKNTKFFTVWREKLMKSEKE